jgi:hypothetical protein
MLIGCGRDQYPVYTGRKGRNTCKSDSLSGSIADIQRAGERPVITQAR